MAALIFPGGTATMIDAQFQALGFFPHPRMIKFLSGPFREWNHKLHHKNITYRYLSSDATAAEESRKQLKKRPPNRHLPIVNNGPITQSTQPLFVQSQLFFVHLFLSSSTRHLPPACQAFIAPPSLSSSCRLIVSTPHGQPQPVPCTSLHYAAYHARRRTGSWFGRLYRCASSF